MNPEMYIFARIMRQNTGSTMSVRLPYCMTQKNAEAYIRQMFPTWEIVYCSEYAPVGEE